MYPPLTEYPTSIHTYIYTPTILTTHRDGELGAIPDMTRRTKDDQHDEEGRDVGRPTGMIRDVGRDVGRDATRRHETANKDEHETDDQTTRDETRNSPRLNLTSALIYTGRDHNLIGNWGREEELTIRRMEYT